MGEDSSMLGSKKSHSIKHSSQRDQSGLANQAELQRSFFWTALLQRNTLLEKENHQLKKELLEQKLMLLEYKTQTEAQLEEARIREERLIKSNEDFKMEMKQQAEETQKSMKQLMEMMKQKQA